MNPFRNFKALTIISIIILSNTLLCNAQAFYWNLKQPEAYRVAKEQDKYILLFVGRSTCGITQKTSDIFSINYFQTLDGPRTVEGPLKSIVDNNYSKWYSDCDNYNNFVETLVYTEEILKVARALPLLFIVNPDVPYINVKSLWGGHTVEQLRDFLTIDLLADSKLKWHKDEKMVFKLAREQRKNIFKMEGRGTSPNSQKVMKRLNEDPLKTLLDDNFILWYSEFKPGDHVTTFSGEGVVAAPYISILYHEEPDNIIEAVWGNQDVEVLEAVLLSYPVSNEIVDSNNIATIWGNVLQISNQINNEQIQIFTITGQQVANIRKNSCSVKIDASHFPKGALIVNSSSGWSKKIMNN